MPTPAPARELSPLERRARAVFRVLFVIWIVLWAASFAIRALSAPSHVVAALALVSGLVWLVAERRASKDE